MYIEIWNLSLIHAYVSSCPTKPLLFAGVVFLLIQPYHAPLYEVKQKYLFTNII